jgi:hypothetical protein
MSDDLDRARDSIDEAREAHEHGDGRARYIAVLISVLAAGLALAEMQEKAAQNEYLTQHIQVSDDYAYYQAKTVRADLFTLHAQMLAALPNAADPAVQQEIAAARATAARLQDDDKTQGRKQLLAQAEHDRAERDRHAHRYEWFELVVGALQIAIVLASVAVVTRVRGLAWGAGAVGAGAIAAGVLIFAGIL